MHKIITKKKIKLFKKIKILDRTFGEKNYLYYYPNFQPYKLWERPIIIRSELHSTTFEQKLFTALIIIARKFYKIIEQIYNITSNIRKS